jgi:hypothetical protein
MAAIEVSGMKGNTAQTMLAIANLEFFAAGVLGSVISSVIIYV